MNEVQQVLQLEIIALGVAAIGGIAALGGWMIAFHKRTIEQAIKDARNEREKLETELREQIKKLENRIKRCEERWEKHFMETKQ